MEELAGIYSTMENNLSNKYYFQSLIKEGNAEKVLSDRQVQNIQTGLFRLLKKQVNRYTSYESSSVRTEKAQQLLEAICYTIGSYLKTVLGIEKQLNLITTDDLEELFTAGLNTLKKYIEESKILLKNLQTEALRVNNLAYYNTIFTGIPEFFRDCDVKYAPQDGEGSIDYPLAIDITDLTGVEYMKEYLTRLTLENSFCKNFNTNTIEQLLNGYHTDYPDLLINIYEIIFTNVIGLVLLNREFDQLNITEEDRFNLKLKLKDLTAEQLQEQLKQAVYRLCEEMKIDDNKLMLYMMETAFSISNRLSKLLLMDKLDMIFISFKNVQANREPVYQDGEMMEDDKLRDFIEEMQDCRYTSDKIEMIKCDIHSLRDLTEVLEVCFYGEEFTDVFRLLSETEITALLNYRKDEEDKEWRKALLKYRKDYLSSPEVNFSKI